MCKGIYEIQVKKNFEINFEKMYYAKFVLPAQLRVLHRPHPRAQKCCSPQPRTSLAQVEKNTVHPLVRPGWERFPWKTPSPHPPPQCPAGENPVEAG